ncbi:SGNH/GDSL hydrolase family protein [Ramlibacter sp.]|uniref:SGNH/GDSL hydrolase family protein n=1 Tax=Ramlibacter sp. TaxID=1917967 RepID=UPI002D4B94A4|nr:SGNH/GDSL hydrolase family protein [Ramlibacter sp.]HYD76341.1 SGNH/GDSL hydrolase family protein [Ramlibacter sp.]
MATALPRRALAAVLAAFALLLNTACGGGGDGEASSPEPSPPLASAAPVSRMFVAGDSLADVGTFGLKATVQNAADRATGYPIYPDLVAADLGVDPLCNHFSSDDGETFTRNEACTDFAVGGAQVVNPVTRGGSNVPLSLQDQLEAAVETNGGAWQAGDLVVVDAGANDAAALADAYLDARQGGTAEAAIYSALLAQQLDASDIADALAQSDGEALAAGRYMQALAQTYWNTVKANTLDKGATRVALLDVPDITRTPRFRAIAAGLDPGGPVTGAEFEAALRQWIVGFNTELARLAADEPRVALVPYFDAFTAQHTRPAEFGLTNVTDPACPPAGDFEACTDAALDASPPAGLAAGWWKTWFYSDEFHPSPRGHELLAATVLQALDRAGWR